MPLQTKAAGDCRGTESDGSLSDTSSLLPIRIGDLTRNVWDALLHAGVIVADISVPNANVYYELGLVHALGKDTLCLKQKGKPLPADFGNAQYYPYDMNSLATGRRKLAKALKDWAKTAHVKAHQVGAMLARAKQGGR